MMLRRSFLALSIASMAAPLVARDRFIIMQSTTSTQNSGLLSAILPQFTAKTGIEVRVVAVGTGQALRNAAKGDGDVLFVHDRAAEEAFLADGHGIARHDVMYNDFIIVGPPADPAVTKGLNNAVAAFTRIAEAGALFASRGDDSGTHKAEMRLWQDVGFDPTSVSGTWYREMGQGMGATLNAGIAMGAYVLTDRATWIAFRNKGQHQILVQGDPRLFNQYGIIAVSPESHPHVRADMAQELIDWLLSPDGQAEIAAYKIDGQQLFFPNASRDN